MARLRQILGKVASQYDKLIAFIMLAGLLFSLSYLAIRVGMIDAIQHRFESEMENIAPRHEHAQPLDASRFEHVVSSIRNPYLVAVDTWTNSVFFPERRVQCVDCKRPIPFDAKLCPYCNAEQPLDEREREDWDGDRDGMWDKWETAHGLDPTDPRDAAWDKDNDGFTNLAEFQAEPKTDPEDPKSYPPPEAELKLTRIDANPFMLRFMSINTLPSGRVFQLNLRQGEQTYFKRMGESVQGFTLHAFEPRTNTVERGGMTFRDDVSILTLKRGNTTIPLIRGKNIQYNEYTAFLYYPPKDLSFQVKHSQTFDLLGKKYRVIDIDSKEHTVVIERLQDGKKIVVRASMARQ